eukprot:CAMPEP_0114330364 /NCGR_PEP_ID=MMETSP0101-20121206/1705_1 /TAXON_ID=38822 ORGANISM="Pteridomonas danica, Strain PT" /NCGR_SAMPLE_ID=MMETSP0101 /ASSEMBLY_ACC=CAM_ASM_000211 /LENGTH=182 /DNA_ID=CAMNT_0001460357 /DNA_START=275 /DNA_END=823 /DNA_ORIENTATION=-
MVSLFYAAEIVGSFASAQLLDAPTDDFTKAFRAYSVFFVVTSVGYGVALVNEVNNQNEIISDRDSLSNMLFGSVAIFSWGFTDALIQGILYWKLSLYYEDDKDQSRAVGFFKMVQSAGWCIGFAISPPTRVSPLIQCALTAACYIIGLCVVDFPTATPTPDEGVMNKVEIAVSSETTHVQQL